MSYEVGSTYKMLRRMDHADPDSPRKIRSITQIAAALGVKPGCLRRLMAYHKPEPHGIRDSEGVILYSRDEFRNWWRGLPEDVRSNAKLSASEGFDKAAYQREYMRKWRAKQKSAKEVE